MSNCSFRNLSLGGRYTHLSSHSSRNFSLRCYSARFSSHSSRNLSLRCRSAHLSSRISWNLSLKCCSTHISSRSSRNFSLRCHSVHFSSHSSRNLSLRCCSAHFSNCSSRNLSLGCRSAHLSSCSSRNLSLGWCSAHLLSPNSHNLSLRWSSAHWKSLSFRASHLDNVLLERLHRWSVAHQVAESCLDDLVRLASRVFVPSSGFCRSVASDGNLVDLSSWPSIFRSLSGYTLQTRLATTPPYVQVYLHTCILSTAYGVIDFSSLIALPMLIYICHQT